MRVTTLRIQAAILEAVDRVRRRRGPWPELPADGAETTAQSRIAAPAPPKPAEPDKPEVGKIHSSA